MLKKTVIITSIITFGFWALIFWNLFTINQEDAEQYQKLIAKKNHLENSFSSQGQITQTRHDVQKDIWFIDEEDRLHFRLHSKTSYLQICLNHKKLQLQETLENLKCWAQDKLYYDNIPMQTIRYFTADLGTFTFPDYLFTAKKVQMSFFHLSGSFLPKTIPQNPYLEGVAKEVFFNLSNNHPEFSAFHLQAKIYPERGK